MLPKSICFVDLETTGTSAWYNRIIEIGIVKVENSKIVQEYSQLVNPETHIDPFIENLTGINSALLENAPNFESVKHEVREILEGSVFVAHNVRFDYGFLKSEFKRTGISYSSKHFCTIKLARLLFPNLKRYNLDSIISNFSIDCKSRHRAFDDAKVLWHFFQKSQKLIKAEIFENAVAVALKKPSAPINLDKKTLDNLPESPGVYIFYGDDETPLYIGKSINIRDRVLSHFANDYMSAVDMKISQQIKHIESVETAGELGALLLESTLIKKHLPIYNKMLRHRRKLTVALKTTRQDGYYSLETKDLDQVSINEIENVIGVFKSQRQLKDFLFQVANTHGLCPKLLNLEKTKKACFSYQLEKCNGACIGREKVLKYNLRFDDAFYPHKVRPWNFGRPIVIKEEGDFEEHFIVDKWCLLGSLRSESDLSDLKDYSFDFDTYKILNKFIKNPKNHHKISYLEN